MYQTLHSKITDCKPNTFFVDELDKGIFHSFRHEHYIAQHNNHIIIKDIFDYTAPLGWLGKLADYLFLKKYMTNLLKKRNDLIKKICGNKFVEANTTE